MTQVEERLHFLFKDAAANARKAIAAGEVTGSWKILDRPGPKAEVMIIGRHEMVDSGFGGSVGSTIVRHLYAEVDTAKSEDGSTTISTTRRIDGNEEEVERIIAWFEQFGPPALASAVRLCMRRMQDSGVQVMEVAAEVLAESVMED